MSRNGLKISPVTILLISLIVLAFFSTDVVAFGAGNIPSYGYLEGKAFRHGDIEDTLAQLAMTASSGGNPLSFLASAVGLKGSKFSGLNVKRVYFGNWLRDYSQAVDVGTLGRGIKLGTIRVLVWVMGFMAHGYATDEFEVTNEKLGVYRPEEHIDNPRDYADNEDARKYDPRLRGPVDPRELQVDPRTAMKNYIANENGGWATSTAYIRASLYKAIETRRKSQSDADTYEALRLLGQALHTLEDLSAHSNWVELALIEMGHRNVFPHVGENTSIHIGGKTVFPLVTGTFGGMDFIHSLLGEATDHLSQTQISDVNTAVTSAGQQGGNSAFTKLQGLMGELPGHQGRELSNEMHTIEANASQMSQRSRGYDGSRAGPTEAWNNQSGDFDPEEIARKIYPILEFRDRVVKAISNTIEKIPGLEPLVEKITDSLTVWVLSLLEPFIKPIVQLVTKNLNAGSALVVSDKAQYEVFDNPNASDPTHSMLSKDHFSCFLNEPAGQIAIVIVRHAVQEVVSAWSDPNVDPRRAIDNIMTVFCHPALLNRNSAVQMEMYAVVERWVASLGASDKARMLDGLSKAGVRAGRHHDSERKDGMGGYGATGGHGHGHSHGGGQGGLGGYIQQAQGMLPGGSHAGGGGGIGHYVQQAQGFLGGGSSHGGGGAGVGSYIQQAQNLLGGQGSGHHGNSGLGGFVQNIAGQLGGGRRREVVDDDLDESRDYRPQSRERDLPINDLDESRDRENRPLYGEERNDQERYERPEPPYPRTPPVPEGYGQEYSEPPRGHGQPYGGHPPYNGGQPPYGYDGRNERRY